MESSFRIARIGGIEVGASWSWLLVVAIVVWSLAAGLFPATYPDLDGGAHLVMALVTAVLFFGSVLLHELGHAWRALREGVPIEGITLWLFGGVAKMRHTPPSPGAAFRVAVAGPLVSAGLALLFGAAAFAGSEGGVHDAVQGVVDYLARINLLVLAFNLVPALPLDGGRILQASLWRRTGSFSTSTVQAATAGRWFGYLLIAVGLLGLFSGNSVGGIWIAFIGWFLVQAASSEATHALVRRALGGVRVREVMTPDPETVPPDLAVEAFLDHAWERRHSTYPVTVDGELAGLVSVRDATALPGAERSSRRVADIMRSRESLVTARADQDLGDVLEVMTSGSERIVVLDDEGARPVGLVAPSDVARAVDIGRARLDEAAPTQTGLRSAGPVVWIVLVVVFALAAGYLYRPPLVVLAPGEVLTVEDGIDIEGVPTTEIDGDYQLTSVRVSDTNAVGAVVAWLRSDREVLSAGEIVPRGSDPSRWFDRQRTLFEESQQMAAAAGANAAGYDVPVDGDGALVVGVLPDSPAADALEPDDVIVELDGEPVPTSDALRDRLRGVNAGTTVELTVDRAGDAGRDTIEVETASLPDLSGDAGLGVLVTTENLTVDLPFEVEFAEDEDLGGPSAGLAYALAIADILDEADLAQGRAIAATGTIGVDGQVGPVGGVDLKARAAEDAGADLFLVPEQDADATGDPDIEVRAARSLDQALNLLRTTA